MIFQNVVISQIKPAKIPERNIKGNFKNTILSLNLKIIGTKYKEEKRFFFFQNNNKFNLFNTEIEYPSNFIQLSIEIFKFFWMNSYNKLNIQVFIYKSSLLIPSILGEFKNFNNINFTHLNLFSLSNKMKYYDRGILYIINNNNLSFSFSNSGLLVNIHGNVFLSAFSFNKNKFHKFFNKIN